MSCTKQFMNWVVVLTILMLLYIPSFGICVVSVNGYHCQAMKCHHLLQVFLQKHQRINDSSSVQALQVKAAGVFKVKLKNNETRVFKVIKKDDLNYRYEATKIASKPFSSGHVIKIIDSHQFSQNDEESGYTFADEFMALEMPYYPQTLQTKYSSIKMNSKTAVLVLEQMAEALNDIHSNKVIHRDIHADNIFVEDDNDEDMHLILGDFSFATEKKVFTRNEAPPEFTNPFKSDIYSLGKTIQLLTDSDDLIPSLSKLLEKMTSNDIETRPDIKEVQETVVKLNKILGRTTSLFSRVKKLYRKLLR
ncbi:hypothetical protein C9374_001804 [Naegleria lovaniensis]|uniref:Protein kinase domain-containing protein n=1 Tax=Naegleria lovaniensis TaxID=51637 RepID=A0AA88GRD7_NAELO|nr:uncharacterized protein C9374_001804 [Naegleria lovaniensis]KAG2387472.1 hypothetical protein C9374_001804 [Naegleria lovaniensis]